MGGSKRRCEYPDLEPGSGQDAVAHRFSGGMSRRGIKSRWGVAGKTGGEERNHGRTRRGRLPDEAGIQQSRHRTTRSACATGVGTRMGGEGVGGVRTSAVGVSRVDIARIGNPGCNTGMMPVVFRMAGHGRARRGGRSPPMRMGTEQHGGAGKPLKGNRQQE